ncbi:unnamed protein product [Rotaria sp. Silwood2]|nr:unnamed protein product [Rotaria sp. Silwood2]CAF2723574.1 unnamed protein product [Rotaria sp. Silwood2]CAF3880319.1 unnamed protein product [Rotaria sp. Silwood2]CAF3895524.1 unnamed protein product [Rotaria sp. Silwood2]
MLMATIGFFTYYDLYGGKPEIYHYQDSSRLSLSTIVTTAHPIKLVSLATIQSSNKLYKLIQLVPFAYLYWFLIGLAILLSLLLIIIFICYFHSYCRKNNKSRNEKKQPLPNFYRYRTANRSSHTYNIYEVPTPHSFRSPIRPRPLNSKKHVNNNQLIRQDLNTIGSPQIPLVNISQTRQSNTFTDTASDLLTEIKSRLSTRSSEISLKADRLCEIPIKRTNTPLNVEFKNDSLLIDMN